MASDEDQSSKTEQPTQRQLERLREQGQVPTSKEVNNLFAILGMLLLVGIAAPWSLGRIGDYMRGAISTVGTTPLENASNIGAVLSQVAVTTLAFLLPLLVLMLVIGYLGGIIQNGPMFSSEALKFNWSRVSPMAGFKRLFSMHSLAEFIKALLKIVVIGAAVGMVLWSYRNLAPTMPDADLFSTLSTTYTLVLYVLGAAFAVMAVLAVADFLFQRFQFMQQNRMSIEDIKREFKEQEGDPHIKAQRRRIALERSRRRMMQEVPKADVVITNPTHYSIALRYKPNEGDSAPVVVAKGVDAIAMRIREIAQEHNIPFYEDPPLARSIYASVDLDQPIPVDLYEAVAKVITFVMQLRDKTRSRAA